MIGLKHSWNVKGYYPNNLWAYRISIINKTNSVAFSPQAIYTD
jgi:hypothetical protein